MNKLCLSVFSFFVLLLPTLGQAYIPPARMIFQRTAENNGSAQYQIEQELQFHAGSEPVTLKETWLIDGEKSLKLTVTGLREWKDKIRWQFLYVGGQKWIAKKGRAESRQVPGEFFERFFHAKSGEALGQWFSQMKLFPASALQKKPLPRKADEFKNESEDFVRLSRTGGAVTWAFGTPAAADGSNLPPGLWIEQDQFVIRRIRFPSGAELSAENFSSFSRGKIFPQIRSLRANQNSVTLSLVSLTAKAAAASQFQPSSLEGDFQLEGLAAHPAQPWIEEFYTRFR